MKVLVVVQARTGSTRLPGKVLLPLAGAPLLLRMVERVRAARTPTDIVVATTTDAADEPVRDLCRAAGLRCFSGHPTDLLDRHYQAALATLGHGDHGIAAADGTWATDTAAVDTAAAPTSATANAAAGAATAASAAGTVASSAADTSVAAPAPDRANGAPAALVVKIPSDCPLIDPAAIDRVIGFHLAHAASFDFVSNLHPATYPDGNDVESMTLPALAAAWREATRPHEREHTTPFLWDQPGRFRLANVAWETGRDLSMSHRFTIDYPQDYDFLRAVYDALWTAERPLFGLPEILELLAARPDIFELNRRYAGVNWYRNHLGELATVGADQTRSPLEA